MIVHTLTELPKEFKEKIDSIEATLREILKWTRFSNISRLKGTLEKELDTDEKKLAFENSDGTRILNDVAAASGAPRDTVYGWWQKWFRLGLVVESETRKGRLAKIVSLDDVGIKIPKKAKSTLAPEATQAPQVEPVQPTSAETKNT
jgi:hypothetical protein